MKRYKRHISWLPTGGILDYRSKVVQIYDKGLEYALVSDDYKQCHHFVWCKDFLHDVVYSTVNKKSFELYKFYYCPIIFPNPSFEKTRIMLTNSRDKNFSSKIPNVLDFINQIETALKMKKTTVRECDCPWAIYEKAGIFLFEGSNRWIKAPSMLSLYTLLLRVGFVHKKEQDFTKTIKEVISKKITPYQRRDSQWLKCSEPALNAILKIGDLNLFKKDIKANYPKQKSIDFVHNKMGAISLANSIEDLKALIP